MLEKFLCPECKGSGYTESYTDCDYCDGTGYATDDTDDPMFSYEKDW